MDKLTPRQAEALTIINRYIEQHGWAPSVRELASILGVTSTSTAHGLVTALREKGYLAPGEGRARQIRVLAPAR